MKRIKKIFGMALALTMLLALSVTVFAAEAGGTPNQTFTISVPSDSNRTYEVFQIFTGDYYETTDGAKYLSNIKWGQNGKTDPGSITVGQEVGQTVLDDLKNINAAGKTDAEKLSVITTYADLNNVVYGKVTSTNPLKVPAGYYLVRDQANTQTEPGTAYTTYVVAVVGADVTIQPKVGVPVVEKKVQDINDTDGNPTGWQDSADYDIGDEVPFQLTATIGENYEDYRTYKLVFHDKLSDGLAFKKDSVVVKVNGVILTDPTKYTVKTGTTDGDTFAIEFANLKTFSQVVNGTRITVEYKATINDQAVIGAAGNPNTVYLEYSNNPNDETKTGKTPEDKVIVFTYEFKVNKQDEERKPLAGAEFTLEKKVKGTAGKDSWVKVEKVIENSPEVNPTTFTFKGLDDGTYRLTETKTPDGYNMIKPIIFKITATHDETGDNPTLLTLQGKAVKETGDVIADGATFAVTVSTGELSTDVVNKKGATLPETGGIGTTVFYVTGAILVIGSAVLLITRKRMK